MKTPSKIPQLSTPSSIPNRPCRRRIPSRKVAERLINATLHPPPNHSLLNLDLSAAACDPESHVASKRHSSHALGFDPSPTKRLKTSHLADDDEETIDQGGPDDFPSEMFDMVEDFHDPLEHRNDQDTQPVMLRLRIHPKGAPRKRMRHSANSNDSHDHDHLVPDDSPETSRCLPIVALWNDTERRVEPSPVSLASLEPALRQNPAFSQYVGQDTGAFPRGFLGRMLPEKEVNAWEADLRKPGLNRRLVMLNPEDESFVPFDQSIVVSELVRLLENEGSEVAMIKKNRVYGGRLTDFHGLSGVRHYVESVDIRGMAHGAESERLKTEVRPMECAVTRYDSDNSLMRGPRLGGRLLSDTFRSCERADEPHFLMSSVREHEVQETPVQPALQQAGENGSLAGKSAASPKRPNVEFPNQCNEPLGSEKGKATPLHSGGEETGKEHTPIVPASLSCSHANRGFSAGADSFLSVRPDSPIVKLSESERKQRRDGAPLLKVITDIFGSDVEDEEDQEGHCQPHDRTVSKNSPNNSESMVTRNELERCKVNKQHPASPSRNELRKSYQIASSEWPGRRMWNFPENLRTEFDEGPLADRVDATRINYELGDFRRVTNEAPENIPQRHPKDTNSFAFALERQLNQRIRTHFRSVGQYSLNRQSVFGEPEQKNSTKVAVQRDCSLVGSVKAFDGNPTNSNGRAPCPAGLDNPPRESAPHSAYVYLWNYLDGTRSPQLFTIKEAVSACQRESIAIYDGQDFGFRYAKESSRVNIFDYDIPKWEQRDVSFDRRLQKVRVWDPSKKCIRRYLYCPNANHLEAWLQGNPDYAVFVPSMLNLSGRVSARTRIEKTDSTAVLSRQQDQFVTTFRNSLIAIAREMKFAGLKSEVEIIPTFWNSFKACKEIRTPFGSRLALYKFWLSNPWLEIYMGQEELAKFEASNGVQLVPVTTSCPAHFAIFWDSSAKKKVLLPRGTQGGGRTILEYLSNNLELELYRGQDSYLHEVINRQIHHEFVHNLLPRHYILTEQRASLHSFFNSGSWIALFVDVKIYSPAVAVFWNRVTKNVLMQPSMDTYISIEEYLRNNAETLELYNGQDLTGELRQDLSAWFDLLKWQPGFSSNSNKAMITKKSFLHRSLASKTSPHIVFSSRIERPADLKIAQVQPKCRLKSNTKEIPAENEQGGSPKDVKTGLNQNSKPNGKELLPNCPKTDGDAKDSSTTLEGDSRKTDIAMDRDEPSVHHEDGGNQTRSDANANDPGANIRSISAEEKYGEMPNVTHDKSKDGNAVGIRMDRGSGRTHIHGETISGVHVNKADSEEIEEKAARQKGTTVPLSSTAEDTKRDDVGFRKEGIAGFDQCLLEKDISREKNRTGTQVATIENAEQQSFEDSRLIQKQTINSGVTTRQQCKRQTANKANGERGFPLPKPTSGNLKQKRQEVSVESTTYSDDDPGNDTGTPDVPTPRSSTAEQPYEKGKNGGGESFCSEDMASRVLGTNDSSKMLLVSSRLSRARKEADKVANLIERAGPKVLQRQLVQDIRQCLREDLLLEVSDSGALVALADRVRSPDFLCAAEALCGYLEALDESRCFTNTTEFDYGPPDVSSIREKLASGKIFTIAAVIDTFKIICGDLLQFHEGSTMQYEAVHLKDSGDKAIAKFVSRNRKIVDEEMRIIRVTDICRRADKIGFCEKERCEKKHKSANPKSPGHGNAIMRVSGYQSEVTHLNYRDEKGYSVMGKRHSARVFGLSLDRETCERRIGNARPCHVCKKELFRSGGDSLQCANYSVGLCDNLVCRNCLEVVFMFDGAEFIKRRALDDWICVQCRGLCSDLSRVATRYEFSERGKERLIDSSLTWPYTGCEATSVSFRLLRRSSKGDFGTDWKKGKDVKLQREEDKWKAVVSLQAGIYRCQVVVDRSMFASTVLHVLSPEKYRKEVQGNDVHPGLPKMPLGNGRETTVTDVHRTKWSMSERFANGPVHSFSKGEGGKLVENCCRTEGYDWRRSKRHAVVKWIPERLRRIDEDNENNEDGIQIVRMSATIRRTRRIFEGMEYPRLQPGMSNATFDKALIAFKFDYMSNETLCGVVTGKSEIHGIGLFTLTGYQKGDFVIEYAGDLIRTPLADIREKRYESGGLGTYLFRINDHKIVDATVKSNRARFTNHSCDPNMEADIVNVRGRDLIVLIATRDIPPYSELTFNYKLPFEDNKLQCLCNCWNCIGVMN